MAQYTTPTLIVGAGPAGLATAGCLSKFGLPYIILERGQHAGEAWHNHYERLHLHTAKRHSSLPHLPFPMQYPQYVPRLDLIAYFDQYAQHFGIQPMFEQDAVSINRTVNGWQTFTRTDEFLSERVVVCTGYNRVPKVPHWKGEEQFKGALLHSSTYRNGSAWKGQNVLVIGIGNTGAELGIDLYEHGATPFISVRHPVNIIRREIFGRPSQESAIMMRNFPTWLYDLIAKTSQRFTIGDLSQYGLITPEYAPSAQLRLFKKTPVIDLGTVDLVKQGKITIVPDVENFGEHTVKFTDGREISFAAVVLATGFTCGLETLLANTSGILDAMGYPQQLWFENMPEQDELYFLGFVISRTGILRDIHLGALEISEQIRQRVQKVMLQKTQSV